MIFDLDGTLVQTERLKAISYARAAIELSPKKLIEEEVIEAFKEVVGLSRQEVATALIERFGLEGPARARKAGFGAKTPWEAFVQIRLPIYEKMLADPEVLRNNQWPHNIALLQKARRTSCKVGLATMSYSPQVRRVLEVLDLADAFDFVATREDVERGKPDPAIYLLVARGLDVSPAECLVVEDSPAGVEAALAAGMEVVAVSTPFTKDRLNESGLLPEERIVNDPGKLLAVVENVVEAAREKGIDGS
jgi:HAD superfamily hydrolase (TIGR01509 family)